MNKLLPIFIVALLTSHTCADEHDQVLKAWGEEFVATWVGESTLEEDLPGQGDKGDPVKLMATVTPDHGVYQVTFTRMVGGKEVDSGVGAAGWDPARKRVRLTTFSKLGVTQNIIYTRVRDTWRSRSVTVHSDGTKESSNGSLDATEDGHVWTLTKRKRGDEELDASKMTFTRK